MIEIDAAIALLDEAISKVAEVRDSLRPPVARDDLDRLGRSLAPLEVPGEVVSLLSWADGQHDMLPYPDREGFDQHSPWIPPLHHGLLLPARGMAMRYDIEWSIVNDRAPGTLPIQLPSVLLPVVGMQLSSASVEIAQEGRPGLVMDTTADSPLDVIAPSLAVVIAAMSDFVDSGLPMNSESFTGTHHEWWTRHQAILEARIAREGWRPWPQRPEINDDPDSWPPRWHTTPWPPRDPPASWPPPDRRR